MSKLILKSNIVSFGRNFSNTLAKKPKCYVKASKFTREDIETFIWTALELKQLDKQGCIKETLRPITKGKFICFLTKQDHYYFASMLRAADFLGVHLVRLLKPEWDNNHEQELIDLRAGLEHEVDMMFLQAKSYHKVCIMAKDSKIPIFCISNCRWATLPILTELMSYQEYFGRLRGLKMLWLGDISPIINTTIQLSLPMGLITRYECSATTPMVLKDALQEKFGKTEQVREHCLDRDKDFKADIVVIKCSSPKLEKIEKRIQTRSDNCVWMHKFPRRKIYELTRVHKGIYLQYENSINFKYMVAGIMLHCLGGYQLQTKKPNF